MVEENVETEERQSKEVEASRRFIRRWIVFGLLLVLVSYFPYPDYRTPVCKTENRQLTDEELIDRFLFKDKAATMSFEEKVMALKERNGAEYPYCCKIEGETRMYGPRDSILDKLYGEHLLEMSLLSPNPYWGTKWQQPNEQYHIAYLVINACGESGHDSTGTGISRDRFESKRQENERYWRAMKE